MADTGCPMSPVHAETFAIFLELFVTKLVVCSCMVFITYNLLCRRYYICDNKLNSLGWREKTGWEQGLKKTIDWYLQHGFKEFWDNGDVEAALQPHPVMHPKQLLSGTAVTSPGC